jgi:hypothetical protein
MRDYFQVFAMPWVAQIGEIGMGGYYTGLYVFGQSAEEVSTRVAATNEIIVGLNPATTVYFSYPIDLQKVYIPLDKSNLMQALRHDLATAIYFNSVGAFNSVGDDYPTYALTNPETACFRVSVNPKQSLRYTGWKDSAGVSRKPAPTDKKGAKGDFGGAGGLLAFVHSLPAYALLLRREGRARDAGIVQEVYNEIIAGKISVTDGLSILRQNGL